MKFYSEYLLCTDQGSQELIPITRTAQVELKLSCEDQEVSSMVKPRLIKEEATRNPQIKLLPSKPTRSLKPTGPSSSKKKQKRTCSTVRNLIGTKIT